MPLEKFPIHQTNQSLHILLNITVGSEANRTLATLNAIFHWLDCQFLSSHTCYNGIKPKDHEMDKNLFHKTILGMSFLTQII